MEHFLRPLAVLMHSNPASAWLYLCANLLHLTISSFWVNYSNHYCDQTALKSSDSKTSVIMIYRSLLQLRFGGKAVHFWLHTLPPESCLGFSHACTFRHNCAFASCGGLIWLLLWSQRFAVFTLWSGRMAILEDIAFILHLWSLDATALLCGITV